MSFDVSLSTIESAILELLQNAALADGTGEPIVEFDARRGLENINRTPAVCCATEVVKYSQVDEETVNWQPEIAVYLVFKNVSNETARRKGAYPILEGAVKLLSLQTLGLSIEPLVPLSASEIFNAALSQRGLIGFRVAFRTDFDVSKYMAEEDAVRFIVSGVKYYLQPDDDKHDAEDVISLGE